MIYIISKRTPAAIRLLKRRADKIEVPTRYIVEWMPIEAVGPSLSRGQRALCWLYPEAWRPSREIESIAAEMAKIARSEVDVFFTTHSDLLIQCLTKEVVPMEIKIEVDPMGYTIQYDKLKFGAGNHRASPHPDDAVPPNSHMAVGIADLAAYAIRAALCEAAPGDMINMEICVTEEVTS